MTATFNLTVCLFDLDDVVCEIFLFIYQKIGLLLAYPLLDLKDENQRANAWEDHHCKTNRLNAEML